MKPSTKRTLFRVESQHSKDFVVLNWHGRPIDEFGFYAESYHRAAKELVQNYGTTGAMRDFEVAPVLFLYRHAFELYLKAFTITGSKILQLVNKPFMPLDKILSTHRLTDFVPFFEGVIKEVEWSWDMGVDGLRKRDDFVSLVQEFDSIDPGSYSFRYPTNPKGQHSLPSHFAFNLSVFAKRIDPLLEVLNGALLGLDDCWDYAAQAAYESRHEAERYWVS